MWGRAGFENGEIPSLGEKNIENGKGTGILADQGD